MTRQMLLLLALGPLGCDVSRNVIEKSGEDPLAIEPQRDRHLAAFWHTVAGVDGSLYGWGRNENGVIVGTAESSVTRPVALANAPSLHALVAGDSYGCGLDENAAAWCWGNNADGQLGQGDAAVYPGFVKVTLAARVAVLSAGQAHACAALDDGTLWCWGKNQEQQLGLAEAQPLPHPSPTRIGDFTDVITVAAGDGHTCAIRQPGSLWCWGRDISAPDPSRAPAKSSPERVGEQDDFVHLSSSQFASCALDRGGSAYCWGRNQFGQLGDAATNVSETTVVATPTPVAASLRFVDIQAGVFESCALSLGQQLWCWGFNEYGELGLGDQARRTAPTLLRSGQRISEFALGWQHLCVRGADGAIACAGRSAEGQVGSGTLQTQSSFEAVMFP